MHHDEECICQHFIIRLSIKAYTSCEYYLFCMFNLKKICIPLFFQLSFVIVVFDCEHGFSLIRLFVIVVFVSMVFHLSDSSLCF
jgi:hypothetical protein